MRKTSLRFAILFQNQPVSRRAKSKTAYAQTSSPNRDRERCSLLHTCTGLRWWTVAMQTYEKLIDCDGAPTPKVAVSPRLPSAASGIVPEPKRRGSKKPPEQRFAVRSGANHPDQSPR